MATCLIQRWSSLEEINLTFFSRCAVEYTNSTTRPGQRPNETFDGLVAVIRIRIPRPDPARCAEQTNRRPAWKRSHRDNGLLRIAVADPTRGTLWPVLNPSRRSLWPVLAVGSFKLVCFRDCGLLGAGEHFGRFCLPQAIVSRDCFAADSGFSFHTPVCPAEFEKSSNLLQLWRFQVVRHLYPPSSKRQRIAESRYLKWPVFKRSVVAAFGCSLT